ncbi:unnamed protein product [Calypogeia fissa]
MASMPPAELEQQSVKQLRDFSFTLREGRTEDAQALGVICFDAFKAFNESVGTDYKMDFHSIEMSVEDRAKQERATSIRLTQVAPNTKSFALFLSLGFIPKYCFGAFCGTVEPEQVEAAASSVGLALNPDAVVRLMQEADVPACAQFFKDTNGYERLPAL